jgi:hypothetical protein
MLFASQGGIVDRSALSDTSNLVPQGRGAR